jgi:hypothetical protein
MIKRYLASSNERFYIHSLNSKPIKWLLLAEVNNVSLVVVPTHAEVNKISLVVVHTHAEIRKKKQEAMGLGTDMKSLRVIWAEDPSGARKGL